MSEQKVERFQEGIKLAKKLGVEVRYAYLDGAGGGLCKVKDKHCLFVDLALDINEQVARLEEAIEQAMKEAS